MAKFHKKLVIVEAFQWFEEDVEGFEKVNVGKDELHQDRYNLVIPTIEGPQYAAEGDWIITDSEGNRSIHDNKTFKKIYEPHVMSIGEHIQKLKDEYIGEKFMGTPDEWYEPCHWWCDNGHRSKRYLKSERLGYDACLACHLPVYLGPKELEGRVPL